MVNTKAEGAHDSGERRGMFHDGQHQSESREGRERRWSDGSGRARGVVGGEKEERRKREGGEKEVGGGANEVGGGEKEVGGGEKEVGGGER